MFFRTTTIIWQLKRFTRCSTSLQAFRQATRQISQIAVNFVGRSAHNQTTDGVSSHREVLIGSQKVDFRVRQHNTRFRHVLDGQLRTSILAGDSADGSTQVVSVQCLHVGHLERFEEKMV